MIRELFPDVELLSSAPPDEVIAVGAALEAGLLVGRELLPQQEESFVADVSASDILVKVFVFLKHVTSPELSELFNQCVRGRTFLRCTKPNWHLLVM